MDAVIVQMHAWFPGPPCTVNGSGLSIWQTLPATDGLPGPPAVCCIDQRFAIAQSKGV